MKKIIALLLVMAMVACLFVGCDNKDDSTGSPANEPASTGSDNPDAENTANGGTYKIIYLTPPPLLTSGPRLRPVFSRL